MRVADPFRGLTPPKTSCPARGGKPPPPPGLSPSPPGLELPPPGLSPLLRRPPGLELMARENPIDPKEPMFVSTTPPTTVPSPLMPLTPASSQEGSGSDRSPTPPAPLPPGVPASAGSDVSGNTTALGGAAVRIVNAGGREGAEWRIPHFCAKLRGLAGKALVSPAFELEGLEDLRLMVLPDDRGNLNEKRGRRKASALEKMTTTGPLRCTVRLKVPNPVGPKLGIMVQVGASRLGPFWSDVAEQTMLGGESLGLDWLKARDASGHLCIGVELIKA